MKTRYLGTTLVVSLAFAAGALAQSAAVPDYAQAKLKDWVTTSQVQSIPAPAGFAIAVGSDVPATVSLYEIPAVKLGLQILDKYHYAYINQKLVVTGPSDRKVIAVVN